MMKSAFFTLAGLALLVSQTLHAAPLRIAADPIPHAEILEYVKKIDPKLDLKIIEMSSGGINPNELLASGEVDANYFQHLPYLKDQEKALGKTFSVAAEVHIEPLGIYSRKVKSLDELPEGASIAVPNNATNLSRSLWLLQSKGVLKLKASGDAASTLVTPADISDNPNKIKIVEIESPQIPRALDDVDAAVINGNYALEAGLVPAKDALGLESASNNPYANLLVTTPELLKDPRIAELAKDLTSPKVAAFIREKYNGSVIPVTAPQHD